VTETKSDPFHEHSIVAPEGIITPVVAEPFKTTCESDWLITMYDLLDAGAMMFLLTPGEPVGMRIAVLA
jgi:hypothetical protein